MKFGLVAASLILVAGGAVGCGGDGGGGIGGLGKDAPSTSEFCGALEDFQDDFKQADPTKDLKGYIQTLKGAAEKLEDVGTPDDMPETAKKGFALTIKKIKALSDDAALDDLAKIGEVSDEDQKKLDALSEYIAKACPGLDGDDGSETSEGSS
jgi:hypothetical protein